MFLSTKNVPRIGLDSPLLAQGIKLSDMPGISDINKTRTQATFEHLLECDVTMVVGPVSRAVTDTTIHNSLHDAKKRRRGKSVIMVATKTDVSIPTRLAIQI